VPNTISVAIELEGKDALKTLTALNKGVKDLGKTGTQSIKSMDVALGSFVGNLGAQAVLKSVQALNQGLQDGAKAALDFGKAVAEINSIAPRTAAETLALKQQLIGLSNEFGGEAQKQARAFYNIVSAGVEGTAKQLDTLETANKAAVAGLVDIDTSARVLVASVNSYAQSGLTANEASDILFTTVKEGITTFGELSSSIGTVAPLAAAAGVEFSELGGTLAFLTKSGVSTAEAATGIRALLTSIIKPAEQASQAAKKLGIDFSTAAIKQKGFVNVLKEIKDATGGSEAELAKLFPNVRALGAAIQITSGNFDDFVRILENTGAATGATDKALTVITDSAAFQFEKLVNQLKNFPTAILTNFEEPLSDGLKAINEFVGGQGVLLLVDAVDGIISAFQFFNSAASEVDQFFNFIAAGALNTAKAWNEFLLSVNSARQALAEFTGETDHLENLKQQEEGLRKNIQVLDQEVMANQQATLKIQAEEEKRFNVAEDFRKKIEAGREAQVAAEDARREEQKVKDDTAAQEELDRVLGNEEKKFNALQELKAAQKELEKEQAEEEKLAKELEGEEEFERLVAALDRELVAKELHRISLLEEEGKRVEAIKKLNEKADKANIKRAKVQAATEVKLARDTTKAKLDIVESGLALAEALAGKSNKAILLAQKALSVAQIIIAGATAEAAALAPPPLGAGPVAGLGLAALIRANTVLKVATVAATSVGSFQSGGIIEGSSQSGDRLTANVNAGEAIFNRRQQQNLFNAVNSGNLGNGSGDTVINIESPTGDIPQETIDNLIEQLNDRQEFGNRTLGVA